MKRRHIVAPLLLLIVGAILAAIFGIPKGNWTPPGQPPDSYPHLRWGNPSGAKEGAADRNNYLMKKPYFALSYNDDKGTPNWVSWRLVKEDHGNASRNNLQFQADDELPPGFKKIVTRDYDGCGFDRGHMCPFADRNATDESGKATFVMTNAVPQSPADNRKGWEQFESYCRTLASDPGKELYVVAGPEGEGGVGEKGPAQSLHGRDGSIVVPAKTWKVVLVLDRDRPPDLDSRLIAVVMPNDQTVGEDWGKYRTSVKAVEELTRYTFFDRADPTVIGSLKQKIDDGPVPPPRDHGR